MGLEFLSLPVEVLCYLSRYLHARDLLALSATCHRLRSILNNKWVWSQYIAREEIGLLLDDIPSVVDPTFTVKHEITTLEPLCKERTSFLNQSRLISNIRLGKSVENSISAFKAYITDFDTVAGIPLKYRKVTYNNVYLFALDCSDDIETQIIKVFNIESTPYVLTSFKLLNHESESLNFHINVFGQKLGVRNNDWYDIYEIKLPDLEFPLLYSFKTKENYMDRFYNTLVLCNFFFVENVTLKAIHVWDLERGTKLSDISIPNKEMDFIMLNCPRNQNRSVLLCLAFSRQNKFSPRIFLYDVDVSQFTYSLALNKNVAEGVVEWFGLVGEQHVVLLAFKTHYTCSAFVFDTNISSLLLEKHNLDSNFSVQHTIIKDYLVLPGLPSSDNVKIMELKNLTVLWEIQIERNLMFGEVQRPVLACIDYVHMSTLGNLLIIYTLGGAQVWNFETSTKLFDLPSAKFVCMNDTYSKLICCCDDTLEVLTLW